MRKVFEMSKGLHSVKVHYSAEYGEYRARLYENGTAYEPGDYFTDDKEDSISTAKAMLLVMEILA